MLERRRRVIEVDDPEAERSALETQLEKKRLLVERLRAGIAKAQKQRIAEAEARVVRRVELVKKREQTARLLLARWEKKAAFAQRKVKKLRARVRYYERKK